MKSAPAILLALTATAHAGGLARVNNLGPRAVGMGGAFTAFADDPTAVFINPADLADAPAQAMLGGEFVVGSRGYKATDGTPKQKASLATPAPTLGAIGRFASDDDQPSRVTFGAGAFNTYGGKLSFPKTGMKALDATEDLLFELDAGAAVRLSDKLSVGASLRVGLGLFATTATMDPYDGDLSANGVGLGGALGLAFTPAPWLRLGVAWRSPMHVATSGSGTVVDMSGTSIRSSVTHEQNWPQSASFGVGLRLTPALRATAQVDWTAWSIVEQLQVSVDKLGPAGVQTFKENWHDTYTGRLGADFAATHALTIRAGTYVDTSAVPDRVIERQYYDTTKYGVAAGASYAATPELRFDAAADITFAPTRTVPDNTADTTAFPADKNIAPGTYNQTLVTFELAAAYLF